MASRLLAILLLLPAISCAAVVEYEYDIDFIQLNITGEPIQALAIDNQVPAPAISASVGDVLRATFHNRLDVITSVHWHGILLPGDQDGVPYLNTQPIGPGESHTFEFPITHAGTFWYHSHSDLQIQRGLYGAVVLTDDAVERSVEERVVLFSDWTDERAETVLGNLKASDDFYSYKRDRIQSWDKVIGAGMSAVQNRLNSSMMRMPPMDLADVGYDAFLVNGQSISQIDDLAPNGGQLKLRMINGSTSSYFDVEYAAGPMTIIAADGQDVQPIQVRRLRISTAETYDVLVPLIDGQASELRATSIDGSGYSSLFIGEGERVLAPDVPPPNLLGQGHSGMSMDMSMDMTMDDSQAMPMHEHGDMPMDDSAEMPMHEHGDMAVDDSAEMPMHEHGEMPAEDSAAMPMHDHGDMPAEDSAAMPMHEHGEMTADGSTEMPMHEHMEMPMSGEVIAHMTDYAALMAVEVTTLPSQQEWREIDLRLTGNMERYVWSFNGRTAREDPQILIRKGENVRFNLTNETMMHHPLHLHGHFFRVVNQHGERSPLKHTVNVPPMGSVVIEFDANEEEDWLFHCHNQFHMKTGMNRVVSYEQTTLLTDEMEVLISPSMRWFDINEFHLLSSFADYEFSLSDERHEFRLEVDTDLADTFEMHATYDYHFNRFVSGFVGMEKREHHHDNTHDIAIAGLNVMLPLMIESEWRVGDHGRFRLELESEIQLTKRFGLDWRWNTDNEYRYGINYRLNNRWSVTVHTDTEYGDGVGVQFFY